ncbi:MAG: sigma-54 dependent transcriptional regulator [Candidatus Latescibacterota bacterium]
MDDDAGLRSLLTVFIESLGYSVCSAATGEEALGCYARIQPALVLLDLRLPIIGGLEVLKRLKAMAPSCRVVMMSSYSDGQAVMEAVQLGAAHYLTKPTPLAELRVLLHKLLEEPLRDVRGAEPELEGLIGSSAVMQEVFRMVRRVASTKATVLIRGESGTGKELVARAIHALGASPDKPFVTVDCTNIPVNLMESELFGHERGAFTDARERKKGLVEVADGGTLFLDEMGLMPLNLQAKLLHVLETQQFRRLGGTEQLKVAVRFLAATNENLEEAVKSGRFREDLYYRLNVVPIYLPPLRERGDDVLLLSDHFVQRYSALHGGGLRRMASDTQALLQAYSWPGNVRELKNVIERAVLMTDQDTIYAEDLIIDRRSRNSAHDTPSALDIGKEGGVTVVFPPQGISLNEVEKHLIEAALQHTGGNISQAAALLHISRDTLRYRLAKHDLADVRL